MLLIGELALWVALLMTAWAAAVSFAGGALERRDLAASGRRALGVAFVGLALATAGVAAALLARDFSLAYVARHTNLALPKPYAVSALWSGAAGAMLLWALAQAGCSAWAAWAVARRSPARAPWTAGVAATLLLFLLLVVCLQANPYERLAWSAPDGQGLDPRLLQPVMVLHRPLLVFGYAALSVPFVLTMGGLLAGRLDAAWAASSRRWALAGWTSLAAGLLLGARGLAATAPTGGWSWSPGEAAAAGVWLAATVLLHTLASAAGRPSYVKWNGVVSALVALATLGGAYAVVAAGAAPPPAAAWAGSGVVFAAAAAWLIAGRARAVFAGAAPAGPPRRRAGERLAHGAAAVVALALAFGAFPSVHDVSLAPGQDAQVADPFGHVWRFVSQGLSRYGTADHDVIALPLETSRDGAPQGLLAPEQWQYRDAQGDSTYAPVTRVATRSAPWLDARVVLVGASGDGALVRITFVPLAAWVWIGGALLVLGGAAALWPRVAPTAPAAPAAQGRPA